MRVPSHCGIPQNEKVDAAAKAAANHSRINPLILPTKSDLTLFAPCIIHYHWSALWQNKSLFLINSLNRKILPPHGLHHTEYLANTKSISADSVSATLVSLTRTYYPTFSPSPVSIAHATHLLPLATFSHAPLSPPFAAVTIYLTPTSSPHLRIIPLLLRS